MKVAVVGKFALPHKKKKRKKKKKGAKQPFLGYFWLTKTIFETTNTCKRHIESWIW